VDSVSHPSTQAEVLPDGGGSRDSQPKWRGPKVRERHAQGGTWTQNQSLNGSPLITKGTGVYNPEHS